MNKVIELSELEKREILTQIINTLPTGRHFEIFLNKFLSQMGFEEVVTTKYIGDNGIDLFCIKKGFDETGIDTLNYYIQAKKYALSNKVQASDIRDLKGSTKKDKDGNVLTCNLINVFITTSFFTKAAKEEAESNPHNPTILIDGLKLLDMCIDKGLCFNFRPVFSSQEAIGISIENKDKISTKMDNITNIGEEFDVKRVITINDIRARILPLPTVIKNIIDINQSSIILTINGKDYTLNLDKSKRYLGGVTQIYKELGLISSNGEFISKLSKWKLTENKINLVIE